MIATLLRPWALVALAGAIAALACWRWSLAAAAADAATAELEQARSTHQAEIERLEAHHQAELERERRRAYELAAARQRETLAEPPSEAGARRSAERRARLARLLRGRDAP